jgi:hypothetical protein
MSAKKKQKPLTYFLSQISPYSPLKAACPSCETTTSFSSHIHLSASEGSIHINYYQCQSCGKLETSDEKGQDGIRVGLETRCECGGQFRRDKNIFCPNCQYRKSEENKAEDNLFATEGEIENLSMRHGVEEMVTGFYGQKDDSGQEEEEEDEGSDMKRLFKALYEITQYGDTFNFGFTPVPKGNDYDIGGGLDEEMESVLTDWMNDCLAEESNHHATDYELNITGNKIELECTASWGGWPYPNLHSYDEIFDDEIINILFPKLDCENVNLEEIDLSFDYNYDGDRYDFDWSTDVVDYYDEENDESYSASITDLKSKLEPLLHENICGFEAGGSVDHEGSWNKSISVTRDEVVVTESITFHLSFDIDDY